MLLFLISWQRQTCIMTLHDEYHEGKGHAGTQGLLQSVCTSCHRSSTKKGQRRTLLPEEAQTQSSLPCNKSKSILPLLITLAAARRRQTDIYLSLSSFSGPLQFSRSSPASETKRQPVRHRSHRLPGRTTTHVTHSSQRADTAGQAGPGQAPASC